MVIGDIIIKDYEILNNPNNFNYNRDQKKLSNQNTIFLAKLYLIPTLILGGTLGYFIYQNYSIRNYISNSNKSISVQSNNTSNKTKLEKLIK